MTRRSLSTLINTSSYLNRETCFPKRIKIETATLDQLVQRLGTDWLIEFAEFLYCETLDSMLFTSSEEILHKLQEHTKKRSTPAQNTIAEETKMLFKLIWCVVKLTQEGTIPPGVNYKPEQATSLAIELVDGLKNCSNGVYERCATNWKRMSSVQTIDNELHAMLVELVTNLSHRYFEDDGIDPAMEVHEKDLYFISANALGLPLEAARGHYHNSPNNDLYQARICEELNDRYTPLQIYAHLENRMRSSLKDNNYVGPMSMDSAGYKPYEYQSWPRALSELFGVKFESSEVYLMDEDYIYLLDVNWVSIREKMLKILNERAIFNGITSVADLEKTIGNKYDLMCWIQLFGNFLGYQRILENSDISLQKIYLRYEYRKSLLDIIKNDSIVDTELIRRIEFNEAHQFFDDKIMEIIKSDGGLTIANMQLFFEHSYFKNPLIYRSYHEIDEYLCRETIIALLLNPDTYEPQYLQLIINKIQQLDHEIQFEILSSVQKDDVSPLMLAPQISKEAVHILLSVVKNLPSHQRLFLFEQRSKILSTPLLLAAGGEGHAGLNEMLQEISTFDFTSQWRLLSAKNIHNANVFMLALRSDENDTEAIKLLFELVGKLSLKNQQEIVFTESMYGDNPLLSAVLSHKAPVIFDHLVKLIENIKPSQQALDTLLTYRISDESIFLFSKRIIGWNLLMIAARYQPRILESLLSMLETSNAEKIKTELICQAGDYQDTPLILAVRNDAKATAAILKRVNGFDLDTQNIVLSACTQTQYNPLMIAASDNPDAIIPLITAMKNLTIEQQTAILFKQGMRDERTPHAQGHALAIAAVKQPNAVKPMCEYLATFDWQTQKLLLKKKNDDDKTMIDLIKAHHPEALEAISEFVTTTNAMLQLEQLVHNYCHPSRTFMNFFVSAPFELLDVEKTVNQTIHINNEIIKTLFLLCVNAGIDKVELNKQSRLLVYLAKMLNQPEFNDLRKVVNKGWNDETDIRVSDILAIVRPVNPSDVERTLTNRSNR